MIGSYGFSLLLVITFSIKRTDNEDHLIPKICGFTKRMKCNVCYVPTIIGILIYFYFLVREKNNSYENLECKMAALTLD